MSSDILFTEDDIYRLLKSLDIAKANGPDGKSACMLKSTASKTTPLITKPFNLSIKSCRPPSSWKISSVVPIPKVQRVTSTSDYRPVSLLSILERHFHFLINYVNTSNCIIHCSWTTVSGVFSRESLPYQLFCTLQMIGSINLKEVMKLVFFDYREAFDTVPHQPLISKVVR